MGGLTTRQLADKRDRVPKERLDGQLQKGAVLQGRYQIVGTLGVGGFSSVYQARDMHFANVTRLCAIKEMVHVSADPKVREVATSSFEREANILATLHHPAVPDVYDYFEESDRIYLVLEYIRGRDLEAILEEQTDFFPSETVLNWALQICDVLAYLHSHEPQPVVFRDFKPSNIMLDPSNRIRLIDFNIAKPFQSGVKGTMIGTEGYSPPEQYRGQSSPAGDIYALGATLHHILTRQDPRMEPPFSFADRPIHTINPGVSPAFEAVIERCLSYDAADRYADGVALRSVLEALSDEGAKASRPAEIWSSVQPSFEAETSFESTKGVSVPASEPDSRTVKPVWTFKCEDEIRSTVAIDQELVFVGAYDNNLYALQAQAGRFVWKYPSSDGIASSPHVYADSVLIGSADSHLYSLSRGEGSLNWRFQTEGPVYSSPRAAFDHVFFGSDDGHLYAVSITSGRRVWRAKAHGMVRSSPYIGEEGVYFGTEGGYVFCVDLSGQTKWQFQAKRAVTSSPVLAEGLLFFGSMDSTVYAVDASSGWSIWRFRTRRPIVSTPAVANGLLFIGSSDGNLYALDINTGRQVWQFQVEGQISSSPATWSDAVYFGATDGSIYCLGMKRGRLRWQFQTDGMIIGSPVVEEGVVYIGSCDHHLYALPA